MKILTIIRGNGYNKISKIVYEDGTYYWGFELNGIRSSFGKYCNKDGGIIKAGEWMDDDCIRLMTSEQIEEELLEKY